MNNQNLPARKNAIYNFIAQNFDQYDYERGFNDNSLGRSEHSYQRFMDLQRRTVDALDHVTVEFLEQIIAFMPHLELVDKESMVKFPANGFVFEGGKLVIFHER